MSSTTEAVRTLIGGPSDFGIGWVIILASSVLTIAVIIFGFLKWLVGRIQEKKRILESVSLLDTGGHISYFTALLGTPVSITPVNDKLEYIFVNKYCYVQALTDQNGTVSLFSITTREKNFNPTLKDRFDNFSLKLGRNTFAQLGHTPKRAVVGSDHGAVTFYSEAYYLGYDGGYRTYFFSFNPNGYGKIGAHPHDFNPALHISPSPTMQDFRENTTINTYTISTYYGPDGHKEVNDSAFFGPRDQQIRTFKKKHFK
ncbi:MAG: ETEC_3214 domain-containing protein [Candidatus Paceibacterota bacterium]|jgi:hypothetical protein